ncbi:tetratricopeptide repeat protein [Caldithrix abyssi]
MKKIWIYWIIALLISISGAQNRESDDFSYPLKLYEQEFYDLAAQQFIKFYNTYPNSDKVDDARYYAGLALYKIKEYQKARAEFQALALEFPKSPFAAEAWFYVGDCAEKLGEYSDAVKAYESLRVLYPQDTRTATATFKAGLINVQQLNDPARAAQLFNIIIERYPDSKVYFPALVKKAAVSFRLGRINDARSLLRRAFEVQDKDQAALAEAYLIQGRINNFLGLIDQAQQDFKQAIALDSGSQIAAMAAIDLTNVLIQTGDYKTAISLLEKQVASNEQPELKNQLIYLLADVYFLSGNYNKAQSSYQTVAAQNDSLQFIIQLKRALSYQKQNFISEAAKLMAQTMGNSALERSAVYQKAVAFYIDFLEQNRYYQQAASFIYHKLTAEKTIVQKAQLVVHLVKILAQKNQWIEIINLVQPFVLAPEPFPEKDDLLFYFALAKEKSEEFDQAAYYFNKLVHEFQASVYSEQAKKHLRFLNDFKIIDQDFALNHLAELLLVSLEAGGQDKGAVLFELGKFYFHDLKNYTKAEQVFKSALNSGANRPGDIYYYLGQTYLKQLEYQEFLNRPVGNLLQLANENFKKAIENEATCSAPDVSAWLLVRATLKPDSQKNRNGKRFIEALLQKYPNSALKEEWLRTLAIDMAFDSSHVQESLKYFRILIEQFQQSEQYPQYLLSYARLLQETNPADARAIYQRIVDGFMFSREAALAIADLIDMYIAQQNFDAAINLFERFQVYFYYSEMLDQLKMRMGEIYLKAGQYDRAIAFYTQTINTPFLNDIILLREFENNEILKDIYFLAEAFRLKGDANSAIRFYRLYLLVEPNGQFADEAHFKAGELYFNSGKYFLAKENFKAVSKQDPRLFTQAVIQAGNIYFLEDDYANAAQFYQQALKNIDVPDLKLKVRQKYILSLIRQGKITEALNLIKTYEKQFKANPDALAQFYIELGNYHRLQKNFSKAEQYFKRVKKKYKNSDYVDDAEYFLGIILITQNKHKEALKILTEFPEKYPESDQLPGVYNTLGTIYFRSEKYDNAIAMFKKALAHCQNCELENNIMSNLIKVYSLTGFWDAAQAMARNYLEKFPEADDRLDKKIIIARAYINLNQFQNAVDYLKSIKAEADAEREPEIQFYIGEALLRAGQYEEAIAEFVKIPLLSKKTKLQWEASALYYSGQCYEKLGRIDDAIRMYKEIIKRPGIDLVLKKDAEKRIKQIQ